MTTRLSFRIHRVVRLNSLWALESREIFEATSCPPTSASFIIFAQGNTALSSGPSLSLDKELPSASGLLSAALCKKKRASLYVLGKTYQMGESLWKGCHSAT